MRTHIYTHSYRHTCRKDDIKCYQTNGGCLTTLVIICLCPDDGLLKSKRLSQYRAIGAMCRVFANSPGDRGSIPGRVIPKTQKMVLDAALLSTQHCKGKGKGKQSREWGSALHYFY